MFEIIALILGVVATMSIALVVVLEVTREKSK